MQAPRLLVNGRRPWSPEWLLVLVSASVVAAFVVVGGAFPQALATSTYPPVLPAVPLACVLALLAAATPGWFTPRPPLQVAAQARVEVVA